MLHLRSRSYKTVVRLLGPDFPVQCWSVKNWKQSENQEKRARKASLCPSNHQKRICLVGFVRSINSPGCAVSCHWTDPSKKLCEPHCACVPWATPRLCCGYLSTHDSFLCQSPAWSRVSTGSKIFIFLSGWAEVFGKSLPSPCNVLESFLLRTKMFILRSKRD